MENSRTLISGPLRELVHDLAGNANSAVHLPTERKELEALLRELAETLLASEQERLKLLESEHMYRSLIEYSNDVIFCVDKQGCYQYVNNVFASAFSQPAEFFLGKTFWDVYPKEHADQRYETTVKVFETGEPQSIEVVVPLPGGTLYFLAKANPVRDRSGKIMQVLTHATDITQRKLAEQKLAREIERRKQLFKQSPDGILIIDMQTAKFLEFNDTAHQQLGYTREEFAEMSIQDVEAIESAEYTRQHIREIIKAGRADFETKHRTKTGEIRNIHVTAQLLDIGGEQIYQCVWRDITERILYEQALRDSEQSYLGLFNSVTDSIFIQDKSGVFLNVNEGAEKMYGYSRVEFMGLTPEFLAEPEGISLNTVWKNNLCGSLAGEPRHCEVVSRRKNGEIFPMDVIFSWGKYFGRDVVITTARDITDTRKTFNELNDSREKLRELNATKDKFFSIIAHDLKNPFQNLLGISDILANEIHNLDQARIAKFAAELASIIKNQYRLLENLLVWSRLQQNEISFAPETMGLKAQVDFAMNLVKPQAEAKNISLINAAADESEVFADPHMLLSVLQNLLTNAIKFTYPDGKVEVEARQLGAGTQITVSDNGIGLNEEDVARLFSTGSKFSYKGTKDEKGTGLGLLLCREFIEKHGGKIQLESKPGFGSKFTLFLPARGVN